MSSQTPLQIQAIELRRLLERSANDPILAPQLKARLKRVEDELAQQPAEAHRELPRTAIFLRGGGVQGSEGIRPSLAGEALIQYEKMFIAQALNDEREAARQTGKERRPRGALKPGLLFTGTPRGSFGLEFVPQTTADDALLDLHAESLEHVAETITQVTSENNAAIELLIPPGLINPLRSFLNVLAQNGAELRLASHGRPSRSLNVAAIERAVERLDKEVIQEEIAIEGEFRGLTLESGVFDLRADDEIITGRVGDALDDDNLERIYSLVNKHCRFRLIKTTVYKAGTPSQPSYVLLDAEELDNA
jgi:hypothetical protein